MRRRRKFERLNREPLSFFKNGLLDSSSASLGVARRIKFMIKLPKKPKIAIAGFSSDEGCQFAILDLGKHILDLFEEVEVVDFKLIEGKKEPAKFDIVFAEGSIITREDEKKIKDLRRRTKILVAIGACAHLGGVPEIKNYAGKDKVFRRVYGNIKGIENPEVRPVAEVVKTDFIIPGCPIDGDEFLKFIYVLKEGREPKIPDRPVCYECVLNGYDCLLQKSVPCLGSIILGGCKAICLKSEYPCEGCRGPIKDADLKTMKKKLRKIISEKEINYLLEKYGIKDNIEKQENENKN